MVRGQVDESGCWLFSLLVIRSVSQLVGPQFYGPSSYSCSQLVRWSVSQFVHWSVSQLEARSVGGSESWSVSHLVDWSISQFVD